MFSTRSSPSPPSSPLKTDSRKLASRSSKQRSLSTSNSASKPPLDWSTGYASASSSAGDGEATDDESTTEESSKVRSPTQSVKPNGNGSLGLNSIRTSPILEEERSRSSPVENSNFGNGHQPGLPQRPRSPVAVVRKRGSRSHSISTSVAVKTHQQRSLLPAQWTITWHIPCMRSSTCVILDVRKAGESSLLVGGVLIVLWRFAFYVGTEPWLINELTSLILVSLIYMFFTRPSSVPVPSSPTPTASSPLLNSRTENRRQSSLSSPVDKRAPVSLVWMTEEKDYRESEEDGLLTALLLGPMITSTMLYNALVHPLKTVNFLPPGWLVEEPAMLPGSEHPIAPGDAVTKGRRNLVQLTTLCSFVLLVHLCASKRAERKYFASGYGYDSWLPRTEGRRSSSYVGFVFAVTSIALALRAIAAWAELRVWQDISYLDVVVITMFYQFCLYVMIRLARRGFTLGELGLVAHGATALFMETVNLTIARIWPVTTAFIQTFRQPTPLLIFQLALIPGAILTGFLLSPLLVLSRHIAQRPAKRLRFPEQNQLHRKALAGGFYAGAALIVFGLIGSWTSWCLNNRNPWVWAALWLLKGKRQWSRPALLVYWGLLGSISVAGWNRQLARARRYRPTVSTIPAEPPADGRGSPHPVADLLDAADKHVPTLSLNARRKFFHALAVVMFIPGIILDPAFAHLAFSAAFALFTFAEYVRYFALYPFGASVHLFMNEFLDHKDSGTAILSHFYLLTGCAGTLWLEGPYRTVELTGVLVLGVGDALASIVGKRMGRHRWAATTAKTVEGSAAFALSVFGCAWVLRGFGMIENFSPWVYLMAVCAASVLEALSTQNDNLTLPMYMWSMLLLLWPTKAGV